MTAASQLLAHKEHQLKRMASGLALLQAIPASSLQGLDAMQALKVAGTLDRKKISITFTQASGSAAVAATRQHTPLPLGHLLTASGVHGPFSVILVNSSELPLSLSVSHAASQGGGFGAGGFMLSQERVYLPAGRSTTLELQLDMAGLAAGQYSQRFMISSPQLHVPASFTAEAQLQDIDIAFSPASIDFGKLAVLQEAGKPLRISNKTSVPLRCAAAAPALSNALP